MATKGGGLLSEWPWERLGSFKYLVLAPWVVHSVVKAINGEVDVGYLIVVPSLLLRMIQGQIWISAARFFEARSRHRILDRGIEFEQVDRERSWDDQIIFNGLIFYAAHMASERAANLPMWRADGAVMIALLHVGPVEFIFYWLHRGLHHHYLYSRFHSHHHASIATEPISSVVHPFGEHIMYFMLFAIPVATTLLTDTGSVVAYIAYTAFIDFMGNMGHCNFELVPDRLFRAFPPLKYLLYTPSFHSLHHTKFRKNFSLFMPLYDYVYGTMDTSSYDLYESIRNKDEEVVDVVHLAHPTTLASIFHQRVGFASLASKPYDPDSWSTWLLTWPAAVLTLPLTWLCRASFVVEMNKLGKLKMQTWLIPRYSFQYGFGYERRAIREMIARAVSDADREGVRVLTLGLLNQSHEELDVGGLVRAGLIRRPKVLRICDGSRLAAAVVLNSVPRGTKRVLMVGNPGRVGCAAAAALCRKGVRVSMPRKHEFYAVQARLSKGYLSLISRRRRMSYASSDEEVWLVGDGVGEEEQRMAAAGTLFIPFSQFPPKKVREDCKYLTTPAMKAPPSLKNNHSCENWLGRRVMSAWRAAGVVHALEGWEHHDFNFFGRSSSGGEDEEEDDEVVNNNNIDDDDIERVWSAALRHGFLPL